MVTSSSMVVETLRLADRRLRATAPNDTHAVCAVIRRAVMALVPVDVFYIGFFADETTLLIPYEFSAGVERPSDVSIFGRTGLAHWVRASGRTYLFSQDDGRLCLAGVPAGEEGPTRDAVVTPVFNPSTNEVIGLLACVSMEPEVFGEEFIEAVKWLADAAALHLDPGEQGVRARLYERLREVDSMAVTSPLEVLEHATRQLAAIADAIDRVDPLEDGASIGIELAAISTECRRAMADMSMMTLRLSSSDSEPPRPAQQLSEREKAVAELIVHESLTNASIARRLSISEKTVKTHVGNILRKTGAKQRSEIAWLIDPNPAR